MDPVGFGVARTLPIDAALLSDVLLRLRRDCTASSLRWTLGDRGSAEVDVNFVSVGAAWSTSARLWNQSGRAVISATLQVIPTAADEIRVTIEATPAPSSSASPPWGRDGRLLADLARATLDELAEELLWHATRAGLTQSS